MLSNLVDSACRFSPSFFYCIGARRSSQSDLTTSEFAASSISPPLNEVDSGGGGSAEVMVYSLGWGMGEPERRGTDRKRAQPAATHAPLSPDDGLEVDVLPLHNQVGGHTRLLVLNDSTVIKPLNIRELHFYQNIPEDIQSFVPRYKGVMQASHLGGSKLDKRYSPCFPDARKSSLGGKRKRDDVFKFKVHRNGNATEVIKSIAHMDNSNKQYFLMMENITSSYRRPCVLDLKMGTRQHGDDASAEKRSKQIAKCQATTSAALGVRLCGMQMYVDGACVRRDKYWGRGLSEAGLREALREFFSGPGGAARARELRAALRRLHALRRAVAKQTSYRFYSCSLLIVYEGDVSESGEDDDDDDEDDVEDEDDDSYDDDDVEESSSDAGAESTSGLPGGAAPGHFDMSTLGKHFAGLPPDEDAVAGFEEAGSPRARAPPPSPDSADSWHAYPAAADAPDAPDAARALHKRRRGAPRGPLGPRARPHVDIRMIDFAHTACAAAAAESPLATSTPHHGPDCGFLTGIDSLKRLLTDILAPPPFS